jgi:hypothetical protein
LEKLPEGLAIAAKSRFQRENKMEKGALVGEASLKYFVDSKLTWLWLPSAPQLDLWRLHALYCF